MELKDFVLLMLIPMILVGIVVYTDKNPDITGFIPKLAIPPQQQQQRESNILGTYSVIPSFRVKTDYNIDEEYRNIKQALQSAINECIQTANTEQCLREKSTQFQWDCIENQETEVLYDFLNKLKDCMNLEEQRVVCKFSFDQRNFDNERNFEIRLTDEVRRVKAELIENNRVLAADYVNLEYLNYTGYNIKDTSSSSADSVMIAVEFNDNLPTVKEAYALDGTTRIPLSKTFLVYKSANEIKFIEAAEEDSFRAPEPANTIISLPKIRGIKFCAKSSKKVYAYDSSDNEIKLRDVVYKFAATYPNPLTDVQSLAAADLESESEKSEASESKTGQFTTKPNLAVSNEYQLAGYDRPEGVIVDTIVLHHTGDDAAAKTYNTLNKRQLGVHYIIDRDGTIYYLVDESKLTYHAKDWNSRSIGIEIVNTGDKSMEYTNAQYDSIRELINDIADRWPSIEVDDEHIKAHYEVSNIGKWDPSPNFEWFRVGLAAHPTLASLGKLPPDGFGYS